MEKWIEECDLDIWLNEFKKTNSSTLSLRPSIDNNIFSSLQFIENEIESFKLHKAFLLNIKKLDSTKQIAWASIYFLSPRVLRIRGLYVKEEFRKQGNMTFLLKEIFKKYKGKANKILSFSTQQGIKFHEKFGFQKIDKFEPRPVEYFDYKTQKFICDKSELIELYEFKINQ